MSTIREEAERVISAVLYQAVVRCAQNPDLDAVNAIESAINHAGLGDLSSHIRTAEKAAIIQKIALQREHLRRQHAEKNMTGEFRRYLWQVNGRSGGVGGLSEADLVTTPALPEAAPVPQIDIKSLSDVVNETIVSNAKTTTRRELLELVSAVSYQHLHDVHQRRFAMSLAKDMAPVFNGRTKPAVPPPDFLQIILDSMRDQPLLPAARKPKRPVLSGDAVNPSANPLRDESGGNQPLQQPMLPRLW